MNASSSTQARTLPLSKIVKGDNPRRYFDKRKHDELVTSIRLRGLIQPILLRPTKDDSDTYAIVAGERRWRAALEAYGNDGEIPVLIREMSDQEALEAAIDENDIRDDASETEQADAAVRAIAANGNDRAEAAARLGWSRAKLDRRLALATLNETVKVALDERRIKVGHAELLAAIPADKQERALSTILGSSLDVAKTRDLLMRVTQTLAHATFERGECLSCPFNSGTQRALFETHVDDGHCTNPGCFQLKTDAAESIRVEEQMRADTAAAAKVETPTSETAQTAVADDEKDSMDVIGTESDALDDETTQQHDDADATGTVTTSPVAATAAVTAAPASTTITASQPTVTAKSIAGRTTDLREASWRTAVARALAGNPAAAEHTILLAAMSGTLSHIKSTTLTARAGLLVDVKFPDLDFKGKLEVIRALPQIEAGKLLAAIGAAYARDVATFTHVADLARAFAVDLRDSWQVDKAFLERFTKDELRFIGKECGLVAHVGDRAFGKLLGSKKTELIDGMLNAAGFAWAGRLPSAMTLDGKFEPPAIIPIPDDVPAQPAIAA